MATLTYREVLNELQALLGQHVAVQVETYEQREGQPEARLVVALFGRLIRGQDIDLAKIGGEHRGPPGESVLFVVGDPRSMARAVFAVRELDFAIGFLEDSGAVAYILEGGVNVKVSVRPGP